QFVRVRGLVGGVYAVKLNRPLRGITDVWRGTVAQPNGSEAFVFDLVEKPTDFEIQRSVVEVEGLLYRTVSYTSKRLDARVAPYLLARNLHVIEATSPS